jgi:hypothetical protein
LRRKQSGVEIFNRSAGHSGVCDSQGLEVGEGDGMREGNVGVETESAENDGLDTK